jgi:hypothetical protein
MCSQQCNIRKYDEQSDCIERNVFVVVAIKWCAEYYLQNMMGKDMKF